MSEPSTGINAFEQGGSTGWARGFAVAMRDLLREPTRTFQEMERDGPLLPALAFALITGFFADAAATGVEWLAPGSLGWFGPALGAGTQAADALDYWLKMGAMGLLELSLTAPLLWVMLTITRLKRPSLRTIYRVCFYSTAPALFGPGLVASTVLGLWSLFLLCVGMKQVGGPRPIAVFGVLFVGQILALVLVVGVLGIINSLG